MQPRHSVCIRYSSVALAVTSAEPNYLHDNDNFGGWVGEEVSECDDRPGYTIRAGGWVVASSIAPRDG